MDSPQAVVERLAREQGVSLAALSRSLGRNVAYLQQYVRRGSPRVLPERDRRRLAAFFGVSEQALSRGEDIEPRDVLVPYLAVAASAGSGAMVPDERVRRQEAFAPATLTRAGVRAEQASVIDVTGDSMVPTLLDGDRLLVDGSATRVPAAGGVFVVRLGDELMVKRVFVRGGTARIVSDNAAYAPREVPAAELAVIGRARLLLRGL